MASTGPRDLVTPEGVVLDFPTAGVASRALARLIDLSVQVVVFSLFAFVVGLLAASAASMGDAADVFAAVALIVAGFVVLVGYPVVLEATWNGRTVGKAALGLRVLTRDGAPIRIRHAAVRNLIGLAECLLFGFVAVISCTWSRANQRLGDLAAGTIVVRDRVGAPGSSVLRFPPPLGMEAYVATLDIGAMTAEQYNLVRSFLTRVLEFDRRARDVLASRIATGLATALGHTPPPTVGPELYLACAASAYQLRHLGPMPSPWSAGWGGPAVPPLA